MERRIEFTPAYDKRNPDSAKNYGVHGVDIRWLLIGDKGAVQFLLFTNWPLPHLRKPWDSREEALFLQPMPADLGYHSPRPLWEGQTAITDACEVLGGTCYYDGSGLNADRIFDVLVIEGGEAVWRELEEYYAQTFGGSECAATED